MSERKVLNKYYPPDFDPTKLPKLNRERNKQFVIRIMAPFSMQCKTCGEYIYKGRKFNSRMETAEGEDYLGLRIYRFHIRCTKCIAVITFKTDPENTDYLMEHGATRLFEAWKKLEQQTAKVNKSWSMVNILAKNSYLCTNPEIYLSYFCVVICSFFCVFCGVIE